MRRLGCREVTESGKADFRNSCEGLFKDLRTLFGLSSGSLRNKVLEDSEENPQKSEWKIGTPRDFRGYPEAAQTPPKAPDMGCCEEILKFFEVFLNPHGQA